MRWPFLLPFVVNLIDIRYEWRKLRFWRPFAPNFPLQPQYLVVGKKTDAR